MSEKFLVRSAISLAAAAVGSLCIGLASESWEAGMISIGVALLIYSGAAMLTYNS